MLKIAVESSKTIGEGKVQSVEMIYYLCRIHLEMHRHGTWGRKKDCVFVLFLVSQFCLVTIFNQRT